MASSALTSAGVGAETAGVLGSGLASGLEGATLGAGTSALTGGDIGKGALYGGLGAGALGLGSSLLGGSGGAASGAATTSSPAASGASAASSGLPAGASGVDLASLTQPGVPAIGAASTAPTASAAASPGATGAVGGAAPAATADSGMHIGNWVANQLGLGENTGNFLDKYGPQILQAGGLLYSGNAQKDALNKQLGPLRASANKLSNESAALSSAMFGGNLPAGAKQAIDLATQSAKTRVRSEYAGLGLAGSTMEADALNNIDRQAAAQTFQMADQLLREGLSTAQLSDQLYSGILGATQSQNKETSDAIANFVAQLSGAQVPSAGKTITLNLGG